MRLLLDRSKYKNILKIANRSEYDKYLITVLNRSTNEIYDSILSSINLQLEEDVLKMLLDVLNKNFVYKDQKEFKYIEHSNYLLLNSLEYKNIPDQYVEKLILPLSAFRALRHGSSDWIQSDLPSDVDVVFFLFDGVEHYHQAIHDFSVREKELRELFDQDFIKLSGLEPTLFYFLTKHFLTKPVESQDREEYMNSVTEIINAYLELPRY